MLERLISPISRTVFMAEFWERAPLFVDRHNDNSAYEDILTFEDLDEYLQKNDLLYPYVRMVKNGTEVPRTNFVRRSTDSKGLQHEFVDTDKLHCELMAGATAVIDGLHRHVHTLFELATSLEREFRSSVQANIYVTPANSQGFDAHWDTHDVMILQISGSKIWKLYDCPIMLPTSKQRSSAAIAKTASYRETVELKPGDFLYIPRGFVHEAESTNTLSIHVTVGLITASVSALFEELLRQSEQHLAFRKSIPNEIYVDGAARAEFRQAFRRIILDLVNAVDLELLLEKQEQSFLMKRFPDTAGRLGDIEETKNIGDRTVLSVRRGIIYRLLEKEDTVELQFYRKVMSFPSFVGETLHSMCLHQTFRLQELDGPIDFPGKCVLARRLAAEGFLRVNSI